MFGYFGVISCKAGDVDIFYEFMPSDAGWYCQDCDVIVSNEFKTCPLCGNGLKYLIQAGLDDVLD